MPAITFNFDAKSLTKARPLKIVCGTKQYSIPTDTLYDPFWKFIQNYQKNFKGNYQFQMLRLLHVAAVKMLGGKLNSKDLKGALFASGGLYLALNQSHSSLAIDRNFGDFTSGFSHQFGVALSVMSMSEAYNVDWDKLTPIPVKGKRSLDYTIQLSSNRWLRLEAKGISSKSRASARKSIFDKKKIERKAISGATNIAMLGVIVQASQNPNQSGFIEFIDPEFDIVPDAQQPSNQVAGRYLHYAGIARFAGLDQVADNFTTRAAALIELSRDRAYVRAQFAPQYQPQEINGRQIIGVQWRLGDATNRQEDIWFYQGMDVNVLEQLLTGELPTVEPYRFTPQDDNFDAVDTTLIQSILPDGSYFGMGVGTIDGFVTVDRREAWQPNRLGRLVDQRR